MMGFWTDREIARREDPFRSGDGFLYLAEIIGRDAIKIGYSKSPASRLPHIGSRLKAKLRLLCQFPATHNDETVLHCRLRGHRHPDFPNSVEIYRPSILCHGLIPTRIRVLGLQALRVSA